MRLSQRTSTVDLTDESWEGWFRATAVSPNAEFGFNVRITGETVVLRHLGCWLVMQMDDEGLKEALLSLGEIMRFHHDNMLLPSVGQEVIPTTTVTVGGGVENLVRADMFLPEGS